MRGEREKDPQALMAEHGIGRRLATRVAALLSHNLDVTATVLAAAGEDDAAGRLLLSPRLLKEPDRVTESWLRERAAELGFEEAELLRLVEGPEGQWRTIALEDDLLAEQTGEGAEGEAPEGLELVRAQPREISPRETESLFAPEEVARLKLSVLTSQNPEERIESVRKLVFAPMEGSQKASIFLNVLTDREAPLRVRREAVRSLEQIGFRTDMAEAVRALFGEEEEEAVYAVQRLSALLQEAEEGEAALVLAVVLEVLDQTENTGIVRALLRLVSRSSELLVTNYEKARQFFRSALRQLARDFDELRYDVERAFTACARSAPELTADIVWSELQRSENARVRSLLISMFESMARTSDQVAKLAERAIREILNPDLPESEKARLRYALVRVGEPAAHVALDRMAEASPNQKTELIRVLDTVCTESEVGDETVQRSVQAFLDQLKLADALTRRTILQASLPGDDRVDTDLQREVASELLSLMAELNLPDSLELSRTTLEKIGPPAVEPSFRFLQRSYPSEAGERAARAVAEILEAHPNSIEDELAENLLELCLGLLEDQAVEKGGFALALGGVCGYTDRGGERFDGCLDQLRGRLWEKPYSVDILDALGVMAGSANARREHQQQLFELFDAIVQHEGRGALAEKAETEEGTVYKFGREIEFDIRIVPSAVHGLERICVSEQASKRMRQEVVKRLLVLWEGVANVRVVWGPAGVESLVRAMCSAACAPRATIQTKTRLGESLLRFLNKINVVRSIGRIFGQADEDPRMRELALEAGDRLLDEWEAADPQDEERRLALLNAAGAIAVNPALDPESEDVRRFRERALEGLFRGLREGFTTVRDTLTKLRECEGLSRAQKQEIDERLGKVFGVVRSEAGP